MAGKTSSPHFSANGSEVKIKIKKPAVNTARAVRDAILRDYFGYTETDIKELDAQMPGKFFICVEGGNGNQEMTPEQVRGWLPDSDGTISVTLNDYWLKNLPAFRERRITTILTQSTGAISDAQVRAEVLADLEKIIHLSGSDRITAVSNLITKGLANGDVINALDYLTAQDGYADNPFLLIARAKIDALNYTTKSGPGYDAQIQPLLAKAIKIASESFNSDAAELASSSISREEAAYINREAAWMFANIGKDRDFQERDWLARFYQMSAEERAGLKEGDVIHIVAPGAAVMSTPRPQTDAEKRRDDLVKKRAEQRKKEELWDKGRGIVETNDPRAVDRTEITPQTTTTTEIKGSSFPNQQKRDAYPHGQNQNNLPPGKVSVTTTGARINPGSIKGANAWGGALELLIKALNGKIFQVRMEAITRYLAEKKKLEIVIQGEKRRVVPLKPATIERLLADLRQNGRTTANPFEKERILMVIAQLEKLREESYAMWKTKK